jgi:hypothetical protein
LASCSSSSTIDSVSFFLPPSTLPSAGLCTVLVVVACR